MYVCTFIYRYVFIYPNMYTKVSKLAGTLFPAEIEAGMLAGLPDRRNLAQAILAQVRLKCPFSSSSLLSFGLALGRSLSLGLLGAGGGC